MTRSLPLLLALLTTALLPAVVHAQPTAFAYQGALDDGGTPASGDYDFRYRLYDQASGGSQLGSTVTQLGIAVDEGVFSTRLDFGAAAWDGAERYLEVRVRPAGSGSYTTLGPRTRVLSAPYAVTAGSVSVPLTLSGAVDFSDGGVVSVMNTGNGNGLQIDSGGHGVQIDSAQNTGILVDSVGSHGLWVESAGGIGVVVNSTNLDGVWVVNAGSNGVHVFTAGNDGFGVTSADGDGVRVGSAGDDGVRVFSAGLYGINADGDEAGAFLRHETSAATRSPDVVLGATTGGTAAADNGVLTTDPAFSGSDLFLTSNDAVIIDLDHDGDETGEFQLIGNGGAVVFQVLDTGAAALAGPLEATGAVTGGAGASRIDHPLDPEGRVLRHAFVESPEMMSVYNGIVTTDAAGEATVELPDYAEALGRDFRYQLTALGTSMPGLFVAEEVRNGRFRIGGGPPGGRVSWQVMGVRHDAWAEANRLPVEADKTGAARGRYLHPAAFGLPAEGGVIGAETDGPSRSVDQALLDAREADEREAKREKQDADRPRREANRPPQRPRPRGQ